MKSFSVKPPANTINDHHKQVHQHAVRVADSKLKHLTCMFLMMRIPHKTYQAHTKKRHMDLISKFDNFQYSDMKFLILDTGNKITSKSLMGYGTRCYWGA